MPPQPTGVLLQCRQGPASDSSDFSSEHTELLSDACLKLSYQEHNGKAVRRHQL